MSDFYQDQIAADAFGHVPLFRDHTRDEDRALLVASIPARAYFHIQEQRYKVDFNSITQPETFDSWAGADALLEILKRGTK